MQIVENNKGLIIRTKTPEKILNTLPKTSRQLEDGSVLVKWTLKTSQVLAKLGYKKTPSPILTTYGWPGIDRPMNHQYSTAAFLTLYKHAFCFNDMGTGKTRSMLWAADYLIEIGMVKRVLVLCPLSILYTSWVDDFMKTVPHRTHVVAVGDAKRRAKLIGSGAEFVITNHDTVKHSRLELARAGFDLIIIDEASAFANTQTDLWKAMNSLVTKDTWLWQATGTPAADSPLKAYGLAKLNNPDSVPKYFTGWRDMTMNKVSQFTLIPKIDAQQTVFNALQPAIRFEKKECLDLPPVTFITREIPMDAKQQEYYDRMKANMLMIAADELITAVNTGVLMSKLLQIASGTVYSDDGNVVDFRAKGRIHELIQIIEQCNEKVLVFVPFKSTIAMVKEALDKHGIASAVIQGGVSATQRRTAVDMLQNTDSVKVLIMQPKTAAHGLNLTAASTTVWYGPVHSLETWRQANNRMDRPGQKNAMTIIKIVGSPVERRVYSVLDRRDATQSDLLKMFKEEMGIA